MPGALQGHSGAKTSAGTVMVCGGEVQAVLQSV